MHGVPILEHRVLRGGSSAKAHAGPNLARIAAVMIESAALYTLASIASIVIQFAAYVPGEPPGDRFSGGFFISMAVRLSSRVRVALLTDVQFLNPAIIILRVAMGVSYTSSTDNSSRSRTFSQGATTGTIGPQPYPGGSSTLRRDALAPKPSLNGDHDISVEDDYDTYALPKIQRQPF
jgi:hypothetical protein